MDKLHSYLFVCIQEKQKNTKRTCNDNRRILKTKNGRIKNEKGVYITPAFPKLLYVLEEDNIVEGRPYYYLTELAAKCTAKRMVPDYISEKKMLELKQTKW